MYRALTAGPIARLGTRSAASPPGYNGEAPTDPSHAWAGLEPACTFHVLTKDWEKTEARAETGTLPKGRRVLWSWQDAASSFLSVSQVAADGTMRADEPEVGLRASACARSARTLQKAWPAREGTLGGSHLLRHWMRSLSRYERAKGYAGTLILWTGSSVMFQSVRSPFQDSAGPLAASLSHVIPEHMTRSNVFVQRYSCSQFHSQVVLVV